MQESRPFFTRVESLRGLGALAVAGWHISGWAVNGVMLFPHVPWEGVGALQNGIGRAGLALLVGHTALLVFFVVSGFVLRVSLQYGPQDFATAGLRFFTARVFRIYPIVIVGAFVAALVYDWHVESHGTPARAVTVSEFVANLLLLDVSMNTSLWALQVEVLMAPVILLLYFLERQLGVKPLVAVVAVTTLLAFRNWTGWQPLSLYFFSFALGTLIPTLGRDFVTGLSPRAARWWLLVAFLGLMLPGTLIGFFSRISTVIEAYAAFVMVSMAAYRFDLRPLALLDWRPVRLLGLASGSYYVLHMALLSYPFTVAVLLVPAAWSASYPAFVGIGVLVLSLAFLAPIAVAGYHLVEAPGIALGRQILRWRRRQVAS